MLNLLSKLGNIFFDANAGGGGGGGSAATSEAGGAAGGGDDLDIKLFDSLPWDELDDTTQATLKKIQNAAVATLQSKKALVGKLEVTDKLARNFQSEADRLKAEAAKNDPAKKKDDDPYLTVVAEELRNAGYSDADATKLAPVFANMFKRTGNLQKEEIGKHLAPMAASVLSSQANQAFLEAQQQDVLGMFQTPEVSQIVWDHVKDRVKNGVETTPDIVLNLAKMAWADQLSKVKAGGGTVVLPDTPPNMTTGGMSGAGRMGGGVSLIASPAANANAAKTVLNDDTKNALAASFKPMLAGLKVMPTELKDILTRKTRG